jgi:phosphatidylglycerophosphatase A
LEKPASTTSPDWRLVRSSPAHLLAFGFGSGLSPVAPGTFGTLVAFPLYWMLSGVPGWAYLVIVAFFFVAGIGFCDAAGKSLGVADHGGIVWDEIVAMLLVLHFAPRTLVGFAAAFLLFRLFDIWKPFPIRWCDQHLKNGFGVMFDDLLAAVYAIICLMVIFSHG